MPKLKSLLDILDVNFMQTVDSFIANTMDVAFICFDHTGPLTKPSNYSDFCISCDKCSGFTCKTCNECRHKTSKVAVKKGEPVIFKCCKGLTVFMVPILVKEQHMATSMGGQVLTEPLDEEQFRKMVRDFGVDEDEYIEKARNIKVVPMKMFKTIVDIVELVTNSLSKAAYLNLQLSKAGYGYKPCNTLSIAELFFLASEKLKESSFTSREKEVLQCMVLGKNNSQIAEELVISVPTVKMHVSSILRKLEAEDRVQVVVKAIKKGLA